MGFEKRLRPKRNEIRALRQERGLSQRDLANLSGISPNLMRRTESGQAVAAETISLLAQALRVEPSVIADEFAPPQSELRSKEAVRVTQPQADYRLPRVTILCFGVLGATMGLFVGMSESPVGATIVSSLFGLFGAGGFLTLLTKYTPEKIKQLQVGAIATCLIALCISCVASTFLGVTLREGYFLEWVTLSTGEQLDNDKVKPDSLLAHYEDLSKDKFIKLLILQAELRKIGVDDAEIDSLVKSFVSETERDATSSRMLDVRAIVQDAESIQRSFGSAEDAVNECIRQLTDAFNQADDERKPLEERLSTLRTTLSRTQSSLRTTERNIVVLGDKIDRVTKGIVDAAQPELAVILDTLSIYREATAKASDDRVSNSSETGILSFKKRAPRLSIKP